MKKSKDAPLDIAGRPLPLRAPVCLWAFGSSRLTQDREGSVMSEFLSPSEYANIPQVQFFSSDDPETPAIDDLLAGVPTEYHLHWMMLVYESMRRRNLWPVNLPLEQMQSEEYMVHYFPEQAAPSPAALQ